MMLNELALLIQQQHFWFHMTECIDWMEHCLPVLQSVVKPMLSYLLCANACSRNRCNTSSQCVFTNECRQPSAWKKKINRADIFDQPVLKLSDQHLLLLSVTWLSLGSKHEPASDLHFTPPPSLFTDLDFLPQEMIYLCIASLNQQHWACMSLSHVFITCE